MTDDFNFPSPDEILKGLPKLPPLEEVVKHTDPKPKPKPKPKKSHGPKVVLLSYKDYVSEAIYELNPKARVVEQHMPDARGVGFFSPLTRSKSPFEFSDYEMNNLRSGRRFCGSLQIAFTDLIERATSQYRDSRLYLASPVFSLSSLKYSKSKILESVQNFEFFTITPRYLWMDKKGPNPYKKHLKKIIKINHEDPRRTSKRDIDVVMRASQ